jgi:hypothetical protein
VYTLKGNALGIGAGNGEAACGRRMMMVMMCDVMYDIGAGGRCRRVRREDDDRGREGRDEATEN